MSEHDWLQEPHRRLNPLTGEWVLVSPQRTARPWLGQIETAAPEITLHYDPTCYLCPGNARAGGAHNPSYTSTFVFDNDYPALVPQIEDPQIEDPAIKNDAIPDHANNHALNRENLFVAEPEPGICRVICFSPRHDLHIATMSLEATRDVVEVWREQTRELLDISYIHNVQIFENRGAMMGASNPHPHCQIWASQSVPNEVMKEDVAQARYLSTRGACLLCSYIDAELKSERLVYRNDSFAVVTPFWAIWPFETMVVSTRHLARLDELDSAESRALAEALQQITQRYDRLFGVPFPYTMGFHQAPKMRPNRNHWHLHAHFYPPLLRSATVRKFMVGYELLGSPQRDITPERAASHLRDAA